MSDVCCKDRLQIDVYTDKDGYLWGIIEDRYIDSRPHKNGFYFDSKIDEIFPHLKHTPRCIVGGDEKDPTDIEKELK